MRFGFIILNYERPKQLLRLAKTLKTLFPSSKIVCNHDFSQCVVERSEFKKVLRFVDPCVPMKWGHISCIRAALTGLQRVFEGDGVDWFFLISGSTYPIQSASVFEKELLKRGCDAFIHSKAVPIQKVNASEDWHGAHIQSRYLKVRVQIPVFDKQGKLRRSLRALPDTFLLNWMLPFGKRCQLHSGGFWFSGNRATAECLLAAPRKFSKLFKHAHTVPIPEEMFFHTVIANTPGLKWTNNDLHHIEWTPRAANPRCLTIRDLSVLRDSEKLWARKIFEGEDDGLLDCLDQMIFE